MNKIQKAGRIISSGSSHLQTVLTHVSALPARLDDAFVNLHHRLFSPADHFLSGFNVHVASAKLQLLP